MRNWQRAVFTTPGALADFREHLAKMIHDEDSLSRVKTPEDLHFQRGKVEGLKLVLSQTNLAAEERK